MVFNSVIVLAVAHVSADAWQHISCYIPTNDRISSHQLLDLVCCFPLQQLGRFALCLWNYLCLSPPSDDPFYSFYDPPSSNDDDDDDSDHHRYYYYYYYHGDGDGDASASSSAVDFDDDYYYHSQSD